MSELVDPGPVDPERVGGRPVDPDLVAAYLAAAGWAAELIGQRSTGARWDEPSALEGYSVGGLAAHLVQAGVTRLWQVLGRPVPEGLTMVDLSAFYGRNRIDAPDERAWDLHAVLIGMGEEQAARGPDDLRRTVAERLAVLTATLPALPAGRPVPVLSVDGAAVELATFVRTRVVELVVHGDDLVASTGGRPLAVPASAAAIAVETLVTLARQRHGDARVIRALTRQERADLQCLRVF